MAESREGNVLLAPGFSQKAEVRANEILYSTAGHTQKGVTLKSGQGVLLEGTPLAYDSSTKRYVKAAAAADVAGFLRLAVDTGASVSDQNKLGNIVLGGYVKTAAIPLGSLVLAEVATALGGTVNAQFGYLKF